MMHPFIKLVKVLTTGIGSTIFNLANCCTNNIIMSRLVGCVLYQFWCRHIFHENTEILKLKRFTDSTPVKLHSHRDMSMPSPWMYSDVLSSYGGNEWV